jgi:hypothetical protein
MKPVLKHHIGYRTVGQTADSYLELPARFTRPSFLVRVETELGRSIKVVVQLRQVRCEHGFLRDVLQVDILCRIKHKHNGMNQNAGCRVKYAKVEVRTFKFKMLFGYEGSTRIFKLRLLHAYEFRSALQVI